MAYLGGAVPTRCHTSYALSLSLSRALSLSSLSLSYLSLNIYTYVIHTHTLTHSHTHTHMAYLEIARIVCSRASRPRLRFEECFQKRCASGGRAISALIEP